MRNKKSVELLGYKVELSERNAKEVLDLTAFIEGQNVDAKLVFFINARVLEDSLIFWVREQNFFKRWKFKRIFNAKNFIKKFTSKELEDYATMVLELEGVDVKKKLAELQLAEKSVKVL